MKAEETVTIDLRGKSAFSDYMVVTTGRSNRHVGAIAENVAKGLKETGIKTIHVEGLTNCDWVLIDSGDVTVMCSRPRILRPEVRTSSTIWKDCGRISVAPWPVSRRIGSHPGCSNLGRDRRGRARMTRAGVSFR